LGIIPDLVPESHCFETFPKATDWLKKNLKKKDLVQVAEEGRIKETVEN
jgi:hypothetical protein